MLFNSYEFIFLFLPLVLSLFYWLRFLVGSHRLPLLVLLAASFFFYAYWEPGYLPVLLFSIAVNFILLGKMRTLETRGRKVALYTGIAFNLMLLGYFKYANFLVENINGVLGGAVGGAHELPLPIGISFFTFQQIGFLVDSYKRPPGASEKLLDYGLFVSFFPQLVAGPIVHHSEMMPQFHVATRKRMVRNMSVGTAFFVFGLAKKILIADRLALFASPIFEKVANGEVVEFFQAWGAALTYSLQIYFDFSGYSDMAIGLAYMFGITLPINFCSPYKATSIIEFWRRWHITLSRFIRDYVYIPLGGNRLGFWRGLVNVFLAMLIAGVWHGAGWTFILWGGLHGGAIVINRLFTHVRKGKTLPGIVGWPMTIVFVVLAWVPFRAESFESSLSLYRSMVLMNGVSLPQSLSAHAGLIADILGGVSVTFSGVSLLNPKVSVLVSCCLVIALFAPNTQTILGQWFTPIRLKGYPDVEPGTKSAATGRGIEWNPSYGWAVVMGMMFAMSLAGMNNASEFLYFNF